MCIRDRCDPVDLPDRISDRASAASNKGIITCGGRRKETGKKCTLLSLDGKAKPFPTMNSLRNRFQMVIIKDILYAIGGYGGAKNTMETINIMENGGWEQQNLPFALHSSCAVVVNNTIVVTGGNHRDGGYVLADVSKKYVRCTDDVSAYHGNERK